MCTRVFLADNEPARAVARTLDFDEEARPTLWWLPAGQPMDGAAGEHSTHWVSRHGVVGVTDLDGVWLDGINERGLGAHALMYTTAGYEPADDRPALATTRWVRYALDLFGSVAGAVEGLSGLRIAPVDVLGEPVGAHLVVEDASGDSAVFEPIDGRMVVHHGREYDVMTNAPSLAEQLANRARYRPFGGDLAPPGDIVSLDRFVRASYFLHYLPRPAERRQALADVVHIASACAKPLGVPYPNGEVYPTRWISAADLTTLDYYFWSRTSPALVWASLRDLASRAEVLCIDPMDPGLVGDLVPAMVAAPTAPESLA